MEAGAKCPGFLFFRIYFVFILKKFE